MGISAFDHPLLSPLVGDDEISELLDAKAELETIFEFETELAEATAEHGIVPAEAARAIKKALATFTPDIDELRRGAARDGVIVPALVRQMRKAVGELHAEYVHFGATSQDAIDAALVLRLKRILAVLGSRLERICRQLDELKVRFGQAPMTGRTRMQSALPITVADRLESWRAPLLRHRTRLDTLLPAVLVVQLGGAAGTLEKFGDKGPEVRSTLAERLGLSDAPQWHSQRDRLAELASWLSLVTGSLAKLGQDVALMAQDGSEIALEGGGASSVMRHKQNPVAAEVLVALARFNASQLSSIHHALVHEQERSGTAWTLEWLVLPHMLMAAAASTRLAKELLENIVRLGLE